jgi:hypothetical protein
VTHKRLQTFPMHCARVLRTSYALDTAAPLAEAASRGSASSVPASRGSASFQRQCQRQLPEAVPASRGSASSVPPQGRQRKQEAFKVISEELVSARSVSRLIQAPHVEDAVADGVHSTSESCSSLLLPRRLLLLRRDSCAAAPLFRAATRLGRPPAAALSPALLC